MNETDLSATLAELYKLQLQNMQAREKQLQNDRDYLAKLKRQLGYGYNPYTVEDDHDD